MGNMRCSSKAARQGPSPVSYWAWSNLGGEFVGEHGGALSAFDEDNQADKVTGGDGLDGEFGDWVQRFAHRLVPHEEAGQRGQAVRQGVVGHEGTPCNSGASLGTLCRKGRRGRP